MKLNDRASQALTNLRINEDFVVFLEWLKENRVKELETCSNAEGNNLFRAQGRAKILGEIQAAFDAAPPTLMKFRQQA